MFRFKLPVKSTVPGSPVCQHVRVNGTASFKTSLAWVANPTQSSPLLLSRPILSRT